MVRAIFGNRGAGIAVLVALVLACAVRLRVADVPLERDEGEYAYAAQLILEGIPPYRIAYNMKFPGTYYAYAAILGLAGHTARGIHLGLMVVNAGTLVLVFLLARRLLGEFAGAIASVAFAVLSLDRWIMGVFAHATHFVVFFAAAGLLLLLLGLERDQASILAGAGTLLGLSVLMKQHGIFFLALAVATVIWSARHGGHPSRGRMLRRVGWTLAGAVLPLAALVGLLGVQGVLERFWFWTVSYASKYATQVPLSDALSALVAHGSLVTQATLPWWIIGAVGLLALWTAPWATRARVFVTGFVAASFLAICPGFYFREHYFIVMLPALGLCVGVALASMSELAARRAGPAAGRGLAFLALAGLVGHYAFVERDYLFTMTPRELSRSRYGANPFIEAPVIARHVRERSGPSERIAILGSEPEIFFYARRKSATGYLYAYPLVENQPYASRMQDEMMREVEAALPAYLVLVRIDASWMPYPAAELRILDWAKRLVQRCYVLEGVADIHSEDETAWAWGSEAGSYRPISPNLVFLFRRTADESCAPRG